MTKNEPVINLSVEFDPCPDASSLIELLENNLLSD